MSQNVATVPDRKSTRLNSSHLVISYAVFCLKKNNNVLQPGPAAPPGPRGATPTRGRSARADPTRTWGGGPTHRGWRPRAAVFLFFFLNGPATPRAQPPPPPRACAH